MHRSRVLIPSRAPQGASGTLIEITPAGAGWDYVHFAVRRLAAGESWTGETAGTEACFVLLSGEVVDRSGASPSQTVRLGPRRSVFEDYPHALYLPRGTAFTVQAVRTSEIADCRSPSEQATSAFEIRPEDCGL